MRTVSQIRDQIRAAWLSNVVMRTLYTLPVGAQWSDYFSAASLETAITDVIALVLSLFEEQFDLHRKDIEGRVIASKPHTLRWYRERMLQFQYGMSLSADSDQYDNTGMLPSAVQAMNIIRYAAAIEANDNTGVPIVRLKCATDSAGSLQPLTSPQLVAATAYINRIKDAGVKIQVFSAAPDAYRATMQIFYDPLVLLADGGLITSPATKPVQIAANTYLQGLPFNGEFSVMALTDAIQQTAGVIIVQINSSEVQYAAQPWQPTGARYTPDAGYMRVLSPNDLVISYIAYV